jgi:hypothetical protein
VGRNWSDNDFDGLDRRQPSSRGRKHERRGQRHDRKHHLRDIKDMVNNGEDVEIDDIMETFEDEE